MARYRLHLKASAAREIESLPSKRDRQRVITRISALADDPRPPGTQKLAGHRDRYRLRQGSYRILYRIDDALALVEIVKVGHRREVYR